MVHLHWNATSVTYWNGIPHSRKKEGAPTLCDNMMELESIMLNEVRQVVKDKYHMISPISGT